VFDVPGEMRRADRPVDHEFPDSETLYRRISSDGRAGRPNDSGVLSHEPLALNYFHAEIQAHAEQRGHLKSIDEEDENWVALWRSQMRASLTVVKEPG